MFSGFPLFLALLALACWAAWLTLNGRIYTSAKAERALTDLSATVDLQPNESVVLDFDEEMGYSQNTAWDAGLRGFVVAADGTYLVNVSMGLSEPWGLNGLKASWTITIAVLNAVDEIVDLREHTVYGNESPDVPPSVAGVSATLELSKGQAIQLATRSTEPNAIAHATASVIRIE